MSKLTYECVACGDVDSIERWQPAYERAVLRPTADGTPEAAEYLDAGEDRNAPFFVCGDCGAEGERIEQVARVLEVGDRWETLRVVAPAETDEEVAA